MNASRRTAGALGAAFGVGASLVMLAGVANAAPYVNTPTATVSTSNPGVGGSLTLTGDGMLPNESVALDVHSVVIRLMVVTADGTGQYTGTVTLPSSLKCHHFISATGLTSGRAVNTNITIGNLNSCKSSSEGGDDSDSKDGEDSTSHHSNLPKTGAAVAGTALLGAALIGGGVTLRNRRQKEKVDA
jgi:LPXTG-motif cell wall-anchored protein